MAVSLFDKQDRFLDRMIKDCKDGRLLSPIFQPYIDWICGKTSTLNCSKDVAYRMLEEASDRMEELFDKHPNAFSNMVTVINDDPWQMYNGFGSDKYLYSYFAYIEGELTNLLMMGFFS